MYESQDKDTPAIRLRIQDGIAHVTLNRPDQGNSIEETFIDAFEAVTLELAERRDIRALLIDSTGPRFSVGGDIGSEASNLELLSRNVRKWNASLNASVARLARMDAPSVVAVQGVVAGGALSIISGCDIIVAADTARFVAAYATIGYCPDLGGTTGLARRVGLARARRFYLLHEKLDAQAAGELGMVDFVLPAQEVAPKALDIARLWASGPTLAYAEIRRLMQSADHTPLEAQMEKETRGIAQLARSEDAHLALRAFLSKKTPTYKGR